MRDLLIDGQLFRIRELQPEDGNRTGWFLDYISDLARDPDAMILKNVPPRFEEEELWLAESIGLAMESTLVMVLAEKEGSLVGLADAKLRPGRSEHVAEVGISIRGKENRGRGLGSVLLEELLDLGTRKLRPRPVMFRLSVFSGNSRALSLYRKHGFEQVASIPEQYEHQGTLLDELILVRRA